MSADLLGFESEDGITKVDAIPVAEKGVANGVATLDGAGTVPLAQIPSSIQDQLNIVGTWDADTNTPTFADGVGVTGDMYKVSVAGTTSLDGFDDWEIGDIAFFSDVLSAWCKLDNSDPEIATVNPATVGTANAIGASVEYATANHVHDHGAQTVETHHAITALGAAGFFPRSSLAATSNPDKNEDNSTDGYEKGSLWVNTSWANDSASICTDDSTAAALWQCLSKPYITGVPPANLELLVCAVQIDSYPGSGTDVRNIAPAAAGEPVGVFDGDTVYVDSAWEFDGADAGIEFQTYAGIDNIFAGIGSFTVWFKAVSDGEGAAGRIVSKDAGDALSGWSFHTSNESGGVVDINLRVRMTGTFGLFTVVGGVILGELTCATVNYDTDNPTTPPTITLQGKDATVATVVTPTGTYPTDAANNLFLGERVAGGASVFDGQIGFLAMHTRGLSQSERERICSSTTPLFVVDPGPDRKTFSNADANTASLGLATIYAQVGTMSAPRTLTLSDATRDLATAGTPISFLVFDESNTVDGTNKIILSPESGNINGASTVEITAGFGNFEVYTFGGDWFAR